MQVQIETSHGRVQGTVTDGVARFLGIPYAASPTGERRFAAPVPPASWDGVRPAIQFGPTPPSPGYRPPYDRIIHQARVPGDDWLTVNVWTPEAAGGGLPVLVWIHGGAFTLGNSALDVYDGHAFARDGVVLVTLNYRLGVDGFAWLPGAPANRGLLDQVRALEWVQENIHAFGGDPHRVTVFGESAGAMSVVSLLAMPTARGLLAGAVAQSGAAQAAARPQDAEQVTREVASRLGVEPTSQGLAEVDLSRLGVVQHEVGDLVSSDPDRFGSVAETGMAFGPIVDGDVLPAHPREALASSEAPRVPLLTGTTSEEFRFFLAPDGTVDSMTPQHLAGLAASRGIPTSVVDLYRRNRPEASPGDVAVALLSDAVFRLPALDLVEGRDGPSWVYEFDWRSPHLGLGAAHAVEIPFVFDTLEAEHAAGLVGTGAPQGLADEVHDAWVRFATTGDPGWSAYDEARSVRVFRADGSVTVTDPRGDERVAWSDGSDPAPTVET